MLLEFGESSANISRVRVCCLGSLSTILCYFILKLICGFYSLSCFEHNPSSAIVNRLEMWWELNEILWSLFKAYNLTLELIFFQSLASPLIINVIFLVLIILLAKILKLFCGLCWNLAELGEDVSKNAQLKSDTRTQFLVSFCLFFHELMA